MIYMVTLIGNLLIGLLGMLFVFFVFVKMHSAVSNTPDYWKELEGDFTTERIQLNGRMIRSLNIIRNLPEGSEIRQAEWEYYNKLNRTYEEMFKTQTDILINKRSM